MAKAYDGLQIERIEFDHHLETSYPTNIYSGCQLGAVTLHTSDASGTPLPTGVCWDDSDPDDPQYIYFFISKTTRD